MKKILPLALLIVLIGAAITMKKQPDELLLTPTPMTQSNVGIQFDLDGQKMKTVWFKVDDLSKLRLIPNFDSKFPTEELYEDNNCNNLINGGFYTQDYKPIGLLVVEGKQMSEKISNQTFDGFLLVAENIVVINRTGDIESVKYALQTGPVLIENGEKESLKLTRDQYARRMFAFIDNDGRLYFATVFNSSSYLQGPLLASIPQVIEIIEENSELQIDSAINLDGGAASAFYTPEFKLEESTSVGSFFCVN
jgi:uncharacterized protein YigE (DUF2233 family)